MGPLPPLYDPSRSRDKLPQPYRMIDKLVAEIVEKALTECVKKDELKKKEKASNIGMVRCRQHGPATGHAELVVKLHNALHGLARHRAMYRADMQRCANCCAAFCTPCHPSSGWQRIMLHHTRHR